MNPFDWFILLGTMIGIAAYGTWRTRHTDNLNTYLKGNLNTGWLTIGLSVMATQARPMKAESRSSKIILACHWR
jgi:Na+/proline symporter